MGIWAALWTSGRRTWGVEPGAWVASWSDGLAPMRLVVATNVAVAALFQPLASGTGSDGRAGVVQRVLDSTLKKLGVALPPKLSAMLKDASSRAGQK